MVRTDEWLVHPFQFAVPCDTQFVAIGSEIPRPRVTWSWLPTIGRKGIIEAIVAVIIAVFLVVFARVEYPDARGIWLEIAVCLAAGTTGRWPRAGAVATGVLLTLLLAYPMDLPRFSVLAMFIPMVSLGARGVAGMRPFFFVWYLLVAGLLDSGLEGSLTEFGLGVVGWLFFALMAWVAGSSVRVLVVDQEVAEQAKAEALKGERRAIARDLHDTVAYSTTTMIMRAEQAKLRGVSDPELEDDLDFIISAGRNSIRDLRSMLEVLRRSDPETDSVPRSPWRIAPLQEVLDERIEHLESLGFEVASFVDMDLNKLPDSIKESLAKVIVEATANMAKHGSTAGPCRVMIERDGVDVTAVFLNAVGEVGGGSQQNHLGLVGLRERVEALGGSLNVRSTQPTWVLEVRLPVGD